MKGHLWISTALLAALLPGSVLGDEVYRHVDANGNITYSDRRASADEERANIGSPNVTTPEATRQINEILQRKSAEEALREQHQLDSINAAEEATQAILRERAGQRAARKQLRGWCREGDPSRGGPGCPG